MKLPPLLLLCAASCVSAMEPAARSLFDGMTLGGWEGNPKHWRVENGAITGEIPEGETLKENQFIYWQGEVHDFDLTVEYRITGGPGANSGIQYRSERQADGAAAGYQADLDDGKLWLGRIYEERKRALLVERGTRVSIAPDGRRWRDAFADADSFKAVPKASDWNTYRVRATATHTEVWINGVLFGVLDDHEAGKAAFGGKIAFQLHSAKGPAKIEFRSVKLVDLGATEAPKYTGVKPAAAATEVRGITPLGDDGKPLNLGFETGTLEGWKAGRPKAMPGSTSR